jgi:hypothetical protein
MKKSPGFFNGTDKEVKAFEEKVKNRLEEQAREVRIEEAFCIYGGTYVERRIHCEKIRSQYPHLPNRSLSDDNLLGEVIFLLTDKSIWAGQTDEYIRNLAMAQNHVYPCEVENTAVSQYHGRTNSP